MTGYWKGLGDMIAGLLEQTNWFDLYIYIMQELLKLSIEVKSTCPEIEIKLLLVITNVVEKAASIERLSNSDKRIKTTASQLPETL